MLNHTRNDSPTKYKSLADTKKVKYGTLQFVYSEGCKQKDNEKSWVEI
jgi:hypothetical protein